MKTDLSAHSSIKIGILGFGTVGSATEKLIRENPQLRIRVKSICDPKIKHHPLLVKNASRIINDPEIDVLVECIGGVEPARKYILEAMKEDKHVVTTNKELVALHMEELGQASLYNNVGFMFEGAVGGGIPIISPLRENLKACNLTEVYGIVNGTTNYILSKMTDEGMEFSKALKIAKKKGYAEADPKLDIKGYDAAYKAAILAAVAFSAKVDFKKVPFEGISKISQVDIKYASEIGYVIKLLAVAKKSKNELEVRVCPILLPKSHPLASVLGPMNAIYVKGKAVGELMFYGQGAGGGPTASAVVADILKIMKKPWAQALELKNLKIKDLSDTQSRYYIRLTTPDKHGVLAGISKAFADQKVSIQAVVQKETVGKSATIVIITHKTPEKNLRRAVDKIKRLSVVKQVNNMIRVGL